MKKTYNKLIRDRIPEIIEKTGLTQREAAKKAHITQQQLSRVENGF